MRWCAACSPGVPRSVTLVSACLRIALRVAVCHCSHSRSSCGSWLAYSSSPRQSGHRPRWRRSRCQVAGSTGGRARRRRWSQYPVRAGSSGDALPATIVCRAISSRRTCGGSSRFPGCRTPTCPGRVEHAEVPGDDPAPWLVRVGESGPLPGQLPQMGVQPAVGAAGHPDPAVAAHPVMIGLSRAMTASALAPRRAFTSADNRQRLWRPRWRVCCRGAHQAACGGGRAGRPAHARRTRASVLCFTAQLRIRGGANAGWLAPGDSSPRRCRSPRHPSNPWRSAGCTRTASGHVSCGTPRTSVDAGASGERRSSRLWGAPRTRRVGRSTRRSPAQDGGRHHLSAMASASIVSVGARPLPFSNTPALSHSRITSLAGNDPSASGWLGA
jgi:hypothetical protein